MGVPTTSARSHWLPLANELQQRAMNIHMNIHHTLHTMNHSTLVGPTHRVPTKPRAKGPMDYILQEHGGATSLSKHYTPTWALCGVVKPLCYFQKLCMDINLNTP